MQLRFRPLACALATALAAPSAFAAATTTQVKFTTTLGTITVTMLPASAPNTVANFLSYVNSGAYDHSLIHRSIPQFVVQGGGFFISKDAFNTIPSRAAINGEFKTSNVRGTLALALSSAGPNSGSDQWFFNLQDNSALLDGSGNGGPFTVFGQVADTAGLAIMDAIAAQKTVNLSGTLGAEFQNLPVVNQTGTTVEENNLIYVESIDTVLAVGSPDYAIAASPAQLTIKAGTTGTSALAVTPSNGYTGTVALSCGPLPIGVSCSFAPASLAFAAGATAAQSSTLTVTVAARTALNDGPNGFTGSSSSSSFGGGSGAGLGAGAGSGLAAVAALFGLACIAVVTLTLKRSRRGFALVFGAGFIAAVSGCGGTSTTAPPATSAAFNVPIRLSDGSVSHPVGLTVTVN